MYKFLLLLTFSAALLTSATAQNNTIPSDDKVLLVNEATVNTAQVDFSPAFYEDGIVFISSNDPSSKDKFFDTNISKAGMSILVAHRGSEGALMKPQLLETAITTRYHQGPLSFDKTATTMYYSSNNIDEKGIKKKAKDNLSHQQLFVSYKKDGKWSIGTRLPFCTDDHDYMHPALSIDGKHLYFTSNRPGGLGSTDIWMSQKVGENWSEPTNMGAKINTDKREAFPFIHADGTLYFASNGREGLGNFDLFYAKNDNKGGLTIAKNMGRPFNSESDDFGLIVDLDRKNGYFTSSRIGGKGEDDIYSFNTPDKILNDEPAPVDVKRKATLFAVNKTDGKEIPMVTVKYLNISQYTIGDMLTDDNGNITRLTSSDNTNMINLVANQPAQTLQSDDKGKTLLSLENGEYLVNLTKEGYISKQIIVKTSEGEDEFLALLERAEGGQPLAGVIRNDKGNPIPGASVTIKDEETGGVQNITTDEKGSFKYYVKPDKNYSMTVTKSNHLAQTTKFNTKGMDAKNSGEIPIKISMPELVSPSLDEGKSIELTNVYYNYNDATLRPDALKDLRPLLAVMKQYPEIEIELGSHTDSRGTDPYNQELSQRRAESVKSYLVNNGVVPRRIKAVGYGETHLRNSCSNDAPCSEEDHQRNRRTEVTITKGVSTANISVVNKDPEVIGGKPASSSSNDTPIASTTNYHTNSSNNNGININSSPVSTSNEFWVVAGSYHEQNNAQDQLEKLQRLGFNETTIEYAQDINFYRVVVKREYDLASATNMMRSLKRSKVTSIFVLRR